jgi:hypothetical protein
MRDFYPPQASYYRCRPVQLPSSSGHRFRKRRSRDIRTEIRRTMTRWAIPRRRRRWARRNRCPPTSTLVVAPNIAVAVFTVRGHCFWVLWCSTFFWVSRVAFFGWPEKKQNKKHSRWADSHTTTIPGQKKSLKWKIGWNQICWHKNQKTRQISRQTGSRFGLPGHPNEITGIIQWQFWWILQRNHFFECI